MITVKDNFAKWGTLMKEKAAAAGMEIGDVAKQQWRLFHGELIKRTPPFSGKSLVRMLRAQGKVLKDVDVENLSDRRVGMRRVEKDIKRVAYGMDGSSPPVAQVYKGQDRNRVYNTGAITDWGVHQKCQGKPAIRIFATKGGQVYGVDEARFMPNATLDDIKGVHNAARLRSGRVSLAGTEDQVIGRWRWLNVIITKASTIKAYIKKKQGNVGQGKGGWAAGYMMAGGKMSPRGWVGKHSSFGRAKATFEPYNCHAETVNHSGWATSGDPDRIISKAAAGREIALAKDIEGILARKFK
jgi:hypothetical protein